MIETAQRALKDNKCHNNLVFTWDKMDNN